MRDLIGFILIISSVLPMGIAEGQIIAMNSVYTAPKLAPYVVLYFIGTLLYLVGLMQIPTKIGLIIGIWEISAVTVAVTTAVYKYGAKLDKGYTVYFAIMVISTYILGWAAEKIFTKAGIE